MIVISIVTLAAYVLLVAVSGALRGREGLAGSAERLARRGRR